MTPIPGRRSRTSTSNHLKARCQHSGTTLTKIRVRLRQCLLDRSSSLRRYLNRNLSFRHVCCLMAQPLVAGCQRRHQTGNHYQSLRLFQRRAPVENPTSPGKARDKYNQPPESILLLLSALIALSKGSRIVLLLSFVTYTPFCGAQLSVPGDRIHHCAQVGGQGKVLQVQRTH
jgi:hypothetical protein